MNRKIKIKKLDQRAIIPKQARQGDAGVDLCACITMKQEFRLGEKAVLVPTGIAVDMTSVPEDMMAVLVPRSGKGHKQGMVLGNTTGIIDKEYQGELMVSVMNRYDEPFFIEPGERFAQLIFIPIIIPAFEEVEDFDKVTVRGASGFGDSGTH